MQGELERIRKQQETYLTVRDNLANIVAEVRSGTDRIASVSGEIAAGNHDLSMRTEEQAS
jgi:methyl-accepting chemotaxis protein